MWWIFRRAKPGEERRRQERHPIRELGQISDLRARQSREFILNNISEDGAAVLLECGAELSEEVELILPGEGFRAKARRVWQASGRAGFRFSD